MAIISSTSIKSLGKLSRLGIECPNCHSKEVAIEVRCEVQSINLIPTWARKKHLIGSCDKCGHSIPFSKIPSYHHPKALDFLKHTPYKWYHFSGLILFGLLVSGFAYLAYSGSKERDELMQNNLKNIHKDNVIFYKLDNGDFSSMKVVETRNDTVFVHENKLSTNSSFYTIDQDNNYSEKLNFYTRKQLDEMLTNETIKDIY